MSKLLIKNGELIQPNGIQGEVDILISDGKVEKIDKSIDCADARVLDAKGLWVMPGFLDLHVHLREPGYEYKEDIKSGTEAAVYGGFTGVACMPNTQPVNDDVSVLSYIQLKAMQANNCKVYPVASITKELQGEELTEMGLLQENGAVAFSDDGKPVSDANRMRLAVQYSKNFDALLMSHCEETALTKEGLMNEGVTSTILGLKGIPNAAETVMVARDIALCEAYDGRVHFCHVSCKESVDMIRQAKKRGVRVTCETAPHYFSADETWVDAKLYDTNTKMNPPLRCKADVQAIKEGLKDGTIDAIATDHAPHHRDEKNVEYQNAYNGIIGLETAFSLAMTNLVATNVLTPVQLVERMSTNPARILNLPTGVIEAEKSADIVLVDPNAKVSYCAQDLHSKSKNSPFLDCELQGKVICTIVDGEIKTQGLREGFDRNQR